VTCRLFIFASGKMTWLKYFPGKLPAFSHQNLYKVPKGTLTSATSVLLLILIAKITIIVTIVVIAVEKACKNACNIQPLPGGIYSPREAA